MNSIGLLRAKLRAWCFEFTSPADVTAAAAAAADDGDAILSTLAGAN